MVILSKVISQGPLIPCQAYYHYEGHFSTTIMPLTNTVLIPLHIDVGSSNVALSITVSGSKIVISA
jgi:hypothetical protein